MRDYRHYRLADTARRRRLATARWSLKAGINVHSIAALMRSSFEDLVLPAGSTDRTLPAESISRSKRNSEFVTPRPEAKVAGRRIRIGRAGITSGLFWSDLLTVSKTIAAFFRPVEAPEDVPSTWARIPCARPSAIANRIRSTSEGGYMSARECHASISRPL
jgi:hypothetical protein